MTDALALFWAGMPPPGLGVYARGHVPPGPWRFVCVNAWRADRAQLVDVARERGAEPWLYGGPSRWTGDAWRASADHLYRVAGELRVPRIIADPEGGAPAGGELAALGARLSELARDVRVGVTFVPSFPGLDELAATAGDAVWSAVQVYGRGALDAATFAAWYARSRARFGARAILSVAGWAHRPELATLAGYQAYLAMLPRVSGAIVWTDAPELPPHVLAALTAWEPGGSGAGTASLAALAFIARPAFAALIGSLAVLFVFAILTIRAVTRA